MEAEELGYWLSFIGLMFGLVNAFVVPRLAAIGSPDAQMVCALLVLALARFVFALAHRKPWLVLAQSLVAMGAGVLSTLLTSQLAVHASEHMGFLLGLSESIKSGAGIIAPMGSALIYARYGTGAPSVASGGLTIAALALYAGVCLRGGGGGGGGGGAADAVAKKRN